MSCSVAKLSKRLSDQFPALYQNRYCDQEDFIIAIIGGESTNKYALYEKPFLLKNFDTKVYLPRVSKENIVLKAVNNGFDMYLSDQDNLNKSFSIKLYPSKGKKWKSLPPPDEQRKDYCICSFMRKLFVIGGNNRGRCRRSAMVYGKQSNSWTSIADMIRGRENAACTVFVVKLKMKVKLLYQEVLVKN